MFLRLQLSLILLFALACMGSAQNICKGSDNDPCKCDLADGSGLIDLSFGSQNKALFSGIPDSDGDGTYSYNPCYPFSSPDSKLSGLAVLWSSSYSLIDLGQQSSATFKLQGTNKSIAYTSGDQSYTSTVILQCQTSGTNSIKDTGIFEFTLTGPNACPVSGSGDGGLSGGSIFLIICSVVFFIYFVGGIVYNKKRKQATGTDMIPNKDFWSSLPGLIKDGFMFLLYKCRGKENPTYGTI